MHLAVFFLCFHSRGTSTALWGPMVTCCQPSPVECHLSPPSQRVSSRYSHVHDNVTLAKVLLQAAVDNLRFTNSNLRFSSVQIVTMGLFRTIALFYLGSFDSIVRRCMIQREQLRAADKRE